MYKSEFAKKKSLSLKPAKVKIGCLPTHRPMTGRLPPLPEEDPMISAPPASTYQK